MSNLITKYPNSIAKTELNNKHQTAADCESNADYKERLLQKDIETFNKAYFVAQEQYGYMIDIINILCTHGQKFITNKLSDTHFVAFLPTKILLDYGIGQYIEQKNLFKKELYKVFNGKETKKLLPYNLNIDILIDIIRVIPIYSKNEDSKYFGINSEDIETAENTEKDSDKNTSEKKHSHGKLKNVNSKKLLGYRIEFYKPLWKSILQNNANNYFNYPSHLQAKINYAITKYGKEERFLKFGSFGNSYNFRKYLLYTCIHDNSTSLTKEFNFLNITRACLPSNIEVKNGKEYIKNYKTSYNFIAKCILMQHQMGLDGLMYGMKYVPTKLAIQGDNIILQVERESKEYSNIPKIEIPQYKQNA